MKVCTVEKCKRELLAHGLCRKHYTQKYKYGKILPITVFDMNNVTLEGDIAKIEIRNNKHEILGHSIIDKSDLDLVKCHKWCKTVTGYIASRINGKVVKLHRLLLNFPDNDIDHKNNDKFDNRRENLRVVSHIVNSHNRKIRNKNLSGFNGVCKIPGSHKWRARIMVRGKDYSVRCDTKEQAVFARKDLENQFKGIIWD